MTMTREKGRWVIKQETREQLEDDFIFSVAFRVANQFNIKQNGQQAVKGFVIGKLDGLKKRLVKYYGLKWYDEVHETSQISVAIQDFIKLALFDGIAQIAAEYAEIPEGFDTSVSRESEGNEGVEENKSNYVNTKEKKDKERQINSGEFGVPE